MGIGTGAGGWVVSPLVLSSERIFAGPGEEPKVEGPRSPEPNGCTPDYAAHPFLDPHLPSRAPGLLRALYQRFLAMRHDDEAYNAFLNKLLHPPGVSHPLKTNLREAASYLAEVAPYLEGLLEMLPREVREPLEPLPELTRQQDIRELMDQMFHAVDPRVRFEAQRKLYLAKLFFDVDHHWLVQRGLLHKHYFERLMDEALFRYTKSEYDVDICCTLGPDGISVEYTVGRERQEQECWSFHNIELEVPRKKGTAHLNIYFYSCRFKREVLPYQYRRGLERYQVQPTEIWGKLRQRRSGSIVSKMIRKGISDPSEIEDILGAMFIVADLAEVESLKDILMDTLGGPFRFRDITDTLTSEKDRTRLNRFSGLGYKVYKTEVDLLHPGATPEEEPYIFPVEIQIYTLESYLRTIHTEHYASHQRFKRRQFLKGLLPYLFPEEIYGRHVLDACLAAEAGGG
jgi:hypothetical protein